MDQILSEIRKERDRQDEKYDGPDHDDSHYPGDWCLILAKYLGRAAAETIDAEPDTGFRDNMIKIAAVAIAATQSFDRVQGLALSQRAGDRAG
ncbi:MAG: hypothetical protein ACR2Q4_05515 [Geminicoccaceae bacterium]